MCALCEGTGPAHFFVDSPSTKLHGDLTMYFKKYFPIRIVHVIHKQVLREGAVNDQTKPADDAKDTFSLNFPRNIDLQTTNNSEKHSEAL